MSNSKDLCPTCNKEIISDSAYGCQRNFLSNISPTGEQIVYEHGCHFPGCHKIHIECANKKIEEARRLINSSSYECTCHEPDLGECPVRSRCDWLKSLGNET